MAIIWAEDETPELMPAPIADTYWCGSCRQEAEGICSHYEQAIAGAEEMAANEEPLDVVILHTRG